MTRRILPLSLFSFIALAVALMLSVSCTGGPPYGTPYYLNPGPQPGQVAIGQINRIEVKPAGVNLVVGGVQKFRAYAYYNDGTSKEVTSSVQWVNQSPGTGAFETGTSRFFGEKPGIAIVRARVSQNGGFANSVAAFINVFSPNADNPPSIPINPSLLNVPDGVRISWGSENNDNDLKGYNIFRTRVSTAHYAIDFDVTGLAHYASDHRVNSAPVLYPPFVDKTVVSGWYYYRITAEDLLGLQSPPSEETSIFVTYRVHYGGAFETDSAKTSYKDAFSTAE